jgi:AcrR family transcriptional regulator
LGKTYNLYVYLAVEYIQTVCLSIIQRKVQPVKESKNALRSDRMRATLIRVARNEFAAKGYAGTSTPEIAAAAEVSRGALYHHFKDKAALFQAVIEHEQAAVAASIEAATAHVSDPFETIIVGGEAYLEALRDPGRRRIMLIEGPAVLGDASFRDMDTRHTARALEASIAKAIAAGTMRPLPVTATTNLLTAAFDRAALANDDSGDYIVALRAIIESLALR